MNVRFLCVWVGLVTLYCLIAVNWPLCSPFAAGLKTDSYNIITLWSPEKQVTQPLSGMIDAKTADQYDTND